MKQGYIPNGGQPVQRMADDERVSLFSFSTAEKCVSHTNQFKPLKANRYRAEAYHCTKYKITIVHTKA